MNKQELIKRVGQQANLTGKDAAAVVNAVLESVEETLANGEKVQIMGFGTFETRARSARTARNPQTGESVEVAATTIPAFKAGKDLKAAVVGKK